MKKKLLGILGAFVAFFVSTSGIYNSVDPKTTNDNYLTFTNNSDSDVYVQLYKKETSNPAPTTSVSLVYSTDDGSNWSTFSKNTNYKIEANKTIKIVAGEEGKPGTGTIINREFSSSTSIHYQFKWYKDELGTAELADPVISASGDVTSLLNGTGGDVNLSTSEASYSYCFNYLFMRNYCLTSAPNLPSTKLAQYCYYGMFYNCTNLITAHELPAATLPEACYSAMFYNCTALVKIPNFAHVTEIGEDAVRDMFYNCTGLNMTNAGIGNWRIGATSGAGKATNMFYGCTGVECNPTPDVGTSYCLSYTTTFAATNSLGGYYKNGSTKQAMVAFSATVAKEDTAFVTSFGFKDTEGSTIIESNDTQLAAFKTNNNGNFYTVIDCDDEGITKNYKAFIVIGSTTTTESDTLTATSNYTNEYTIPA